jgi:hypothetical protein
VPVVRGHVRIASAGPLIIWQSATPLLSPGSARGGVPADRIRPVRTGFPAVDRPTDFSATDRHRVADLPGTDVKPR